MPCTVELPHALLLQAVPSLQNTMKASACYTDTATAGAGGLLSFEPRVQAEADEEDRWLKRTVSLPALSRDCGARPLMWLRAEGLGSARSTEDGHSGQDFRTLARPSSQALAGPTWAEEKDTTSGVADSASKGSGRTDKRKQMKKIDLFARESAHVDKHRQLKVMLREQRLQDRSLSCSRHLLGHLARPKDGPWRGKIVDQQKMEKSVNRIAGHISGCSLARRELQEMQKKMAFASGPKESAMNFDLKHAFADAFHRPHPLDQE